MRIERIAVVVGGLLALGSPAGAEIVLAPRVALGSVVDEPPGGDPEQVLTHPYIDSTAAMERRAIAKFDVGGLAGRHVVRGWLQVTVAQTDTIDTGDRVFHWVLFATSSCTIELADFNAPVNQQTWPRCRNPVYEMAIPFPIDGRPFRELMQSNPRCVGFRVRSWTMDAASILKNAKLELDVRPPPDAGMDMAVGPDGGADLGQGPDAGPDAGLDVVILDVATDKSLDARLDLVGDTVTASDLGADSPAVEVDASREDLPTPADLGHMDPRADMRPADGAPGATDGGPVDSRRSDASASSGNSGCGIAPAGGTQRPFWVMLLLGLALLSRWRSKR